MSEIDLIKYYNKFCEDKRLNSRHGQVEFRITMKYIKKFLHEFNSPKIIDVGAGTGKYAIELNNMGYDVTAIELVKYNLGILKSKCNGVKAFQGDARNLKKFKDEQFDIVLLFGPMYHLLSYDDKLMAMQEAKRITKKGGIIFISYLMNDYAILVHGFRDGNIVNEIKNNKIGEGFQILSAEPDLYSYSRIDEIDKLKNDCGLTRIGIVAQDGPTDYMRQVVNSFTEDEFELYIKYIESIAERKEMLGASSHVLDILKV